MEDSQRRFVETKSQLADVEEKYKKILQDKESLSKALEENEKSSAETYQKLYSAETKLQENNELISSLQERFETCNDKERVLAEKQETISRLTQAIEDKNECLTRASDRIASMERKQEEQVKSINLLKHLLNLRKEELKRESYDE